MSPYAGSLLLQVMPLIMAGIQHVKPVGCEDHAELVQDATAAQMLDSCERHGKALIPRSVAYYAVQSVKTGRRTTCSGRSNPLGAAAQRDGLQAPVSMDKPLEISEDEDMTFGDMLVDKKDDPATISARNIDWSEFMKTQDARSVDLVVGMAQGKMTKDIAREHFITPARVVQLKRKVGNQIKQAWGDQIVAQATTKPAWRRVMDNRKW